jgi:hypothetical protein
MSQYDPTHEQVQQLEHTVKLSLIVTWRNKHQPMQVPNGEQFHYIQLFSIGMFEKLNEKIKTGCV